MPKSVAFILLKATEILKLIASSSFPPPHAGVLRTLEIVHAATGSLTTPEAHDALHAMRTPPGWPAMVLARAGCAETERRGFLHELVYEPPYGRRLPRPRSDFGSIAITMIKSVGVKFQGLTDFEDLFVRKIVTFGFGHGRSARKHARD